MTQSENIITEQKDRKYSSFATLKDLRSLMTLSDIKAVSFIYSLLLALCASVFEGISVALLVPLFKGLVGGDFSFIKEVAVLKTIIAAYPEYFPFGNKNFVFLLIAVTFAATNLKILFQYLSNFTVLRVLRSFSSSLRQLVYKRYLTFGKSFFDSKNQGELHQIISTHVNTIAGSLQSFQTGLYALSSLVVYVIMMFYISWELTLLVLALFPVLHFSLKSLIAKLSESSKKYAEHFSRLGWQISNTLSAISLIKVYKNEEQEQQKFREVSERIEDIEIKLGKKHLLIHPIQESISLFFLFFLLIIICFLNSLEGDWNIASYFVFLLILRRCSTMFGALNNMSSSLAMIAGPIVEVQEIFSDKDKYIIPDGVKHFEDIQSSIEIKNLQYKYGDNLNVLQNVSFQVKNKKVTAFVGASGAGKTTLMNLIMRLYDPPQKSILVDNIDIREYTLQSWRQAISYVSQDALLFHGTLRENICYGLSDISDEKLEYILEKSYLHEAIENLPQKLETIVGDRGVKLSGGEKQRVAIARALLKDSPILLLDEATSALDSQTEEHIHRAINELTKNRTALVIAHRLFTIRNADHIIVLDSGQVAEEGTLDELLEKEGLFRKYWEGQKFF